MAVFRSMAEVPPLTYGLIMADPPWSFDNWSTRGEAKNAKAQYACMDLAALKALPIGQVAAGDCVLWLWATNPMLPQALEVMAAWGFRFTTAGHWVKRTLGGKLAFGTGYVLRCAGEPFLIGTMGKPAFSRATRSVIEGPVREHSRKPDEAFEAAAQLVPLSGRRIEVFAREERPGWDAMGDQVGVFAGPAHG